MELAIKKLPYVHMLKALITPTTKEVTMPIEGIKDGMEIMGLSFWVDPKLKREEVIEIFGKYELMCTECRWVCGEDEVKDDFNPCPKCGFKNPVYVVVNDNRCIFELNFKAIVQPWLRVHLKRIPVGVATTTPMEVRDFKSSFLRGLRIKPEDGMSFTLRWPLNPPAIPESREVKIALSCIVPL